MQTISFGFFESIQRDHPNSHKNLYIYKENKKQRHFIEGKTFHSQISSTFISFI
jgi:hypothetical protein